jgi:mRNA interferase RelE/StbE
MIVKITRQARMELEDLPTVIQDRVQWIVQRLANWPEVSGAKPLSGSLAGWYRIRTGDYRIRFVVVGNEIIIDRIAHRRDVYEE